MTIKQDVEAQIRGWFPQEPKVSSQQVNSLSSVGSHSYRNFRILSRVAILAAAIPFIALIWFSNINPFIRFVYQIVILAVVAVLSDRSDRYAKRKYPLKEL
jgi:hypothetical protein